MITSFLPRLITAISDIVQPVSDQCLAKGLIPDSVYKRVLESGGTSEHKARTLILAVKTSTETDSRCLEILLNILEEQLPYGIRDNLLSAIRKDITEKANICREVIPLTHSVQLVPSEQLPRESTAVHTQLLGRLEDSIRQHERACTEKNLLEQRLKAKSEKYEKLKHELEELKSQNEEISASIHDDMARAQSRISACESGIVNLQTRIKELEKIIEERDMQAKRGRDTVTIQTKNLFTIFTKYNQQEIEKAVRMKEKELKLELHEKEIRIRQLEAKSEPQVDINPPDILKPINRENLNRFIRGHKDRWRDLGSKLGFSKKELDDIDEEYSPDDFRRLLNDWLTWYPGDDRGSTSFATYTQLKRALVEAGLGNVARDLPPYEKINST